MERKYRQRGYRDQERNDKKRERPERPAEPRPKQDLLGPRTPRMVGTVMRARCWSCGAVLPRDFDPTAQCPRCHSELHCCRQCVHFDTSRQFECTQPIPERIAKKDAKNECRFFECRMTVEKDTSPMNYAPSAPAPVAAAKPSDARKAFEDLFKK